MDVLLLFSNSSVRLCVLVTWKTTAPGIWCSSVGRGLHLCNAVAKIKDGRVRSRASFYI